MKGNRVAHGVGYLRHKPNGNHRQKDKHIQEQRARKQLRGRGGAGRGGVGERL